jgi:polyisoprenoid-binding protein YceI
MKLELLAICFALAALAAAQDVSKDTPIDAARSTITIHVGKAGLLSAAGHEHWINAPIAGGSIRESDSPHVEFTVETAAMTVKPDPKVDAKTQAQIQKDMEEMTLDTAKFPKLWFVSQKVERSGAAWKVEGTLTLHGVSKTVILNVTKDGGAYVSRTTLKQTDFGIKPVTVGGGVIKVKDQVEIEFRIVPQGS